MAEGLFDKTTVAVACAACGHANRKPLGWLREHRRFICVSCGAGVHVTDRDTLMLIEQSEAVLEAFIKALSTRPNGV